MPETALDTCICMDIRVAARRLTEIYDEALAPSGITVTQFSQLHKIKTLGSPTFKELSDASGLDRSTLGRNIRVLEKLELVSIQTGEDARTRKILVTHKGMNAFKDAAPLWFSVQQERKNAIGADARHQLTDLLEKLTGVTS